ncbi:N-acetyltransferase [Mesorhizobium sp. SB112]|uniref:GNAT family N-acetyltransferase n=1 Tax=Mesorhizobium sp. SB112 TaxID=3151853 RepID=UPI0032650F28
MEIRDERSDDEEAVNRLVEQAFGQPAEAQLVVQLRKSGEAVVSLVAVDNARIVGHVMLSTMAAPFPALGLAPLAVEPDFQKKGIGAALIKAAIDRAEKMGSRAIFVLGDPAYYGRFGFRADLAAGFSTPYAGEYFMVLPLGGSLPVSTGQIDYSPSFSGLE